MKISAHNVIILDKSNKNGRLYTKEAVTKCLIEQGSFVPVKYYPVDLTGDKQNASKCEWDCALLLGYGNLIYNPETNSYDFEGELDEQGEKLLSSLPYLTIRCKAGLSQSVGEVYVIEEISTIETYMSIDSAFVDMPNIEIVRE